MKKKFTKSALGLAVEDCLEATINGLPQGLKRNVAKFALVESIAETARLWFSDVSVLNKRWLY